MLALRIDDITKAINGQLLSGDANRLATGVSTDTRILHSGDLFIALVGGNTDGHKFVGSAIQSGASAIVVSDKKSVPEGSAIPVILVNDTVTALGDLAAYYRRLFNLMVIGITGSVGKTMTREMTASILGQKLAVLKNEMNYNNEIGVPMALLGLNYKHKAAVIEMAMRGTGEIRRLGEIAAPSIGVVTNIGITHIERLGSRDAIADAKSELITCLPSDGFAVLNADDDYHNHLRSVSPCKVLSFGISAAADISGTDLVSDDSGYYTFTLNLPNGHIRIKLPVMGIHSVYNALAASAAAHCAGADLDMIALGLSDFKQPSMRMEFITTDGGFAILSDCYNASPASAAAAIETLMSIKGYTRRIAVLGDMLELGRYADESHRDIGQRLAEAGIDMLIAVGDLSKGIVNGAIECGFPKDAIYWYGDSAQAASFVKTIACKGDLLLVKGSRGMQMERIVRAMQGE